MMPFLASSQVVVVGDSGSPSSAIKTTVFDGVHPKVVVDSSDMGDTIANAVKAAVKATLKKADADDAAEAAREAAEEAADRARDAADNAKAKAKAIVIHSSKSKSSDGDFEAIPITAIAFVFIYLIVKAIMAPFTQRAANRRDTGLPVAGRMSDEEQAVLLRLQQTLTKMESRVESLETILIEQHRSKEKYGTKL